MEFIDLKTQYQAIRRNVDKRIKAVLNHGQFIMGPEVTDLEERLANYTGSKYCIGVANGTDALMVAMMALGIGPGDEVITTPFSFIATVEMILMLGAKPVFVDIDPNNYNLDPSLLDAAITNKTKLIMPVDLYGQCADFDPINAVANRRGIPVIEDAAQSIGATYKGRQAGTLGTIGCTSFFPSKPLGCYGEGGACFTDDKKLADKIRQIRNHGQESRYHHVVLGMNSRLPTLQAAVLLAKLDVFPEEINLRQRAAGLYDKALPEQVTAPQVEPYNTSVYAQYTIQVANREQVRNRLQRMGIPTAIHYPTPLHQQPIMAHTSAAKQKFPMAEKAAERVISLPFHPYLKEEEIKLIAKSLAEALA